MQFQKSNYDLYEVINCLQEILPAELSIFKLIEYSGVTISNNMDIYKFILILSYSPLLDWQDDRQLNHDIDVSNINPCFHFVTKGILDRHKLCLKNAPQYSYVKNDPKVSIIIPNYNNSAFLEKCLQSVLAQSLDNLEIIFVDDCSTDNSMDIALNLACHDKRIKIYRLPKNSSQHMARKYGVNKAHGQYIMFLDSDDFYFENTCKIAVSAMQDNVDMAFFNTHIINNDMPLERVDKINKFCNKLPAGIYDKDAIFNILLINKNLIHNLWNKIFKREVCVLAFSSMEDGYFIGGEDFYEFVALLANSKVIKKIDDCLYNYNYGIGISTSNIDRIKKYEHSDMLSAVTNLCNMYNLNSYLYHIKSILFEWSINNSLDLSDDLFFKSLDKQKKSYGEEFFYKNILNIYFEKWYKFAKYQYVNKQVLNSDNIGIYISSSYNNYVALIFICEYLVQYGYIVNIMVNNNFIPKWFLSRYSVVKLEPLLKSKGKFSDRNTMAFLNFHRILKEKNIKKIVFFENNISENTFWNVFIAKTMGCIVINIYKKEIINDIVELSHQYPIDNIIDMINIADKIYVSSIIDLLFFASYHNNLCNKLNFCMISSEICNVSVSQQQYYNLFNMLV